MEQVAIRDLKGQSSSLEVQDVLERCRATLLMLFGVGPLATDRSPAVLKWKLGSAHTCLQTLGAIRELMASPLACDKLIANQNPQAAKSGKSGYCRVRPTWIDLAKQSGAILNTDRAQVSSDAWCFTLDELMRYSEAIYQAGFCDKQAQVFEQKAMELLQMKTH